MSSEPSITSDYVKIPSTVTIPESPVITIHPATLVTSIPSVLPTPPITPTITTAPRPILKTKTSTTPISTYVPASPFSLVSMSTDPMTPHASLQAPLKRHLTLLHPQTPIEIVHFCALKLLSKETPEGYRGAWKPIYEPDESGEKVDLATAGLEFDAPKEYRGKSRSRSNSGHGAGEGKGSGTDRRLEGMYRVARESYGLIELKDKL